MLYRKILKQLTYFFSTALILWGCGESNDSANNAPIETNNSIVSSNDIGFIPSSSENINTICQNGEVFTDLNASYICSNDQWILVTQPISTVPSSNEKSSILDNTLCQEGESFSDGSTRYVCSRGQFIEYNIELSNSSELNFQSQYNSSSSLGSTLVNGILTDLRDEQTYRVVVIGSQTWMAQNLNYKTASSSCWRNDEYNCTNFGKLYSWNDAKIACPTGWHLPNDAEWMTLFSSVGGQTTAGKNLKSTYGWTGEGGTDAYGFSAKSAGYTFNGITTEYNLGDYASFWSSTNCHSMGLTSNSDIAKLDDMTTGCDFSDLDYVRCIQDGSFINLSSSSNASPITGVLTDKRDGQIYKTVTISYQAIKTTWMAQNLNYETDSSFCYNDNVEKCSKYGRLYTWTVATTVCPSGWHLPSKADFEMLMSVAQYSANALKSSSWNSGINSLSFSVIPTGIKNDSGRFYKNEDIETDFWSSTEWISQFSSSEKSTEAYSFYFYDASNQVKLIPRDKGYGLSVRCIKD